MYDKCYYEADTISLDNNSLQTGIKVRNTVRFFFFWKTTLTLSDVVSCICVKELLRWVHCH